MASSSELNATQKICAVMRSLSDGLPRRLVDISANTRLNKATILRILNDLIDEGFVQRAPNSKAFELGDEILSMSTGTRRSFDLAELAQPSLLRLAAKSGDTALLSVRRNVEALYIARSVGDHPLQPSYLKIGSRRLLGVGAGSLALLAWLPEAEAEAVIDIVIARQLKKSRITKALLKERIKAARLIGHTLLIDAAYFGMGGVGVPVHDEGGRLIAALSIGAASERIKSREAMLVSALALEAKHLSKALRS